MRTEYVFVDGPFDDMDEEIAALRLEVEKNSDFFEAIFEASSAYCEGTLPDRYRTHVR